MEKPLSHNCLFFLLSGNLCSETILWSMYLPIIQILQTCILIFLGGYLCYQVILYMGAVCVYLTLQFKFIWGLFLITQNANFPKEIHFRSTWFTCKAPFAHAITLMSHQHFNISNHPQTSCLLNSLFSIALQQIKHQSVESLGAVSIRKTVLPGMAIPMLKLRRPNGRLIFNMEIAIRR